MYPVNQYMDPYYSHYRNHTPYPYYSPHGWEAGQPRAMDPSYRPPGYGPWPHNGGMHHPHPSEFHCCCNHTYAPGYYSFRPPFPQELPPPHLYYHGPFPQHPNTCPSYFFPPHPYPVDQTPYGHDKFKSHCCGCPNHVCQGAEKSNVKIEEERPDVEPGSGQKDANSASIIPHPNNQYPFLWLPSGNMECKTNGRRYESPPQLLNGWVPAGVKRTGDVKQQEQDDQKAKQLQWPIVWMPAGYDELKQKAKELKEMDQSSKVSEQEPPSPKIKIIPLSWFENGHHDQKPAVQDGSGDHSDRSTMVGQPATTEYQDGMPVEGNHKTTPVVPKRLNNERKPARENYKTIPVVPEKDIDEKKAGTYRTIPVMTQKENDEKKAGVGDKKEVKKASNAEMDGQNGKTNHSESSAAKHSKLPPVCLRVDPLPRKKSGNGSSRSPSPPTRKDANKGEKDVSEAQSLNFEPKQSDAKKHITVSEEKEKSPDEMMKRMVFSNETVPAASTEHSQAEGVLTVNDDQKVQASGTSVDAQEKPDAKNEIVAQENIGAESLKEGDKSTDRDGIINHEAAKDDAKTCRANLSEPDAAVHIQSAYRGYDVRRWQPLEKLRKIRDVHEQMQSVRKQLQNLEASSAKPTEKEQVAIGETIMNLLLKLDTIQGLHQSVREARKSVARELISLQEKLDTLCKLKSDESNPTASQEEQPERDEHIETAGRPPIAEASGEEKATQLDEVQEPSSAESMELHDISMGLRQDSDSTKQNHQIEGASTTTREETPEGKAAAQVECPGASWMDMMSDAALSGHSTDMNKQDENSNVIPKEEATEEEKAMKPLVHSMEPLHEAASSEDSDGLKQCTASTVQNLHIEESNAGVSTTGAEDIKANAATASMESGTETEKGSAVEKQAQEASAVESLERKHDVPSAEEGQQKESSAPVGHLEDSSVSSNDVESSEHNLTPANDSIMSNVDQSEEYRDVNMQEQVADTMDSSEEADRTQEASMIDVEIALSADAEKPDQASLLEQPSESNSAPEQTVSEEPDDAVQLGAYDLPHVDQTNYRTTNALTRGSANGEEADNTRAETVSPELDSCESCSHEGAIAGHERTEVEVPSDSQTNVQKEHACVDNSPTDVLPSEADECTDTLKEVLVDTMGSNSDEELGVQVGNETPKDTQERATEANSAEGEADSPKEDFGVQTENKASEEAFSASASPGDLKDSEEKNLAEENQKLKEMLQKLLASGNDQMGVITDLSEKVKTLERKLRKKRQKVRVHKPSRHAMAKVH